jgi:general secretion pathway protein N
MSSLFQSKLVRVVFILFLILYFLYMVISRAPAIWAAWGVHQAVPNLWLSSVDGSLWKGRAQSAQVEIGPTHLPLGEVNWALSPLSLFTLRPCVRFSTELPNQTLDGRLCQSLLGDTALVESLNVNAPISAVEALLPIDATGYVSLMVKRAKFTNKAEVKSLDAQFSWENARASTGDAWINLGTFAATAKENGMGGVSAEIFDIQSPYKSELSAEWAAGKDWSIAGTIAPQAGAASVVVEGLKILGEDLGDGAYRVQWP